MARAPRAAPGCPPAAAPPARPPPPPPRTVSLQGRSAGLTSHQSHPTQHRHRPLPLNPVVPSPGVLISRSKMRGRDWLPMARRSRNPEVTTRAQRSPLRSKSALVATVVPMRMERMREGSRGRSRRCGMPGERAGRGSGRAGGRLWPGTRLALRCTCALLEDAPNSLPRGVRVVGRILGKQLDDDRVVAPVRARDLRTRGHASGCLSRAGREVDLERRRHRHD